MQRSQKQSQMRVVLPYSRTWQSPQTVSLRKRLLGDFGIFPWEKNTRWLSQWQGG
uniref:Uncharacterized protein n=1 Tax=Arundo donax TaxID=35708 RepID=A0A0A9DPR9_ARUDO